MEEKSKKPSSLVLTKKILEEPKNLPALFEVPQFRNNCIVNYQKTMGVSSEKAAITYERERVLFMKTLESNKALADCDRFSIYSSMVELFASGLSLNEGMTYIIPYKKKAQFQIGYLGRLEQMKQIPDVAFVDQPQVVYSCDKFEYELGDSTKVIRHAPGAKTDSDRITHVYMHITYRSVGKKTYIMTRDEVLAIRDRYSDSYKKYAAAIAKNPNLKMGDSIPMKGSYGDYSVDPPMWVTSEAEAFRKTLIKRVWKMMEKTPRQIALEKQLENRPDPDEAIDYGIDEQEPETSAIEHQEETVEQPVVQEVPDNVDAETGEMTDEETGFTI